MSGKLARRFLADRRATVAVEMAVVTPALVLILVGMSDVGLGLRVKAQIAASARAGTQYVMLHGYTTATPVEAAATSATALSVTAVATSYKGCPTTTGITQQTANCSDGTAASAYASVTVTGTYKPLSKIIWSSSPVTFTATSVVRYG